MDARRELLRRILAATAGDARLDEPQREEILGHLEDSVEEKVGAGASELEASARAFEEIGDLRRIAGEFPRQAPVLATADGPGVTWATYGGILEGYAMLVAFCGFQIWITPKFGELFHQVNVQMPAMTTFFMTLSAAMSRWLPLTLLLVAGMGALLFGLARRRYTRPLTFLLGIGSIVLLLAAVIAVGLPFVAMQERMGGH